MSGNFDFPPASSSEPSDVPGNLLLQEPAVISAAGGSNSATQSQAPSTQARLQHLRDLLSRERSLERDHERANRTAPNSSPESSLPSDLGPERRRRHHIRRNIPLLRPQQSSGANGAAFATPSLPHPPSRLRAVASSGERTSPRRSGDANGHQSSPASALRQASVRLAEASSDLRSLLDDPVDMAQPQGITRRSAGEDDSNRRVKRRKLDSKSTEPSFSNVDYGYFGQVEAGPLKMEIVSCDGGNYSDPRGAHKDYYVDNVLRNDSDVYCTKSSKCNMMLRQRGETPFCLKKLVVSAPRTGFTAPVKEGMVFVSMDSGDLLARTAAYDSRSQNASSLITDHVSDLYGLPHPSAFRPQHLDDYLLAGPSSRPSMQPPLTPWVSHVLRSEGNQRASGSISPLDMEGGDFAYDSPDNCIEDPTDPNYIVYPQNLDGSASGAPPFNVTTDTTDGSEGDSNFSEDEEESDLERMISRANAQENSRRNRRRRIGSLSEAWVNRRFNETNEDPEDDHLWQGESVDLPPLRSNRGSGSRPTPSQLQRLARQRLDMIAASQATSRRSQTPSGSGAQQANPARSTEGERNSGNSDMLAPHARFFVKRRKSKCSIVFDPPVSGRYILLKLWSPTHEQNIDIQSIIAYGYGGPRYFPATELR